ncbi:Nucleolar GTP-binding protein 1 [Conglomerata obtusa]
MANFKCINTVPPATQLIDIALNKTQRKTPTVVHPKYEISRIRSFYIKKVRFTTKEFTDRLSTITSQFPRLEDIHPFYSDLMNVLYDRDHYKMALGHISATKGSVDRIGKEYGKLLKYAESLYRAKQLKRAALGRMATMVKKLSKTNEYLEEVRQHLSRLPNIDPSAMSLILCGFPNVGKSSFMNKVSRAQVDVQPYAFTTKNLYVGHFDYNYSRWQVIDTPGILDHELEERNTIEMQTITALAHIQSSVLFLIDISTTCGYTIEEQIRLCESLESLLGDFIVVLSKSDLINYNNNNNDNNNNNNDKSRKRLSEFLKERKYIFMSTNTDENVERVKKMACELLLNKRIQKKVGSDKINEFINRIKIIKPSVTHERAEPRLKMEEIETEKIKFEKNREEYVFDERENYFSEFKYDTIPEFYQGKNIADFIDVEIKEKIKLLEIEEEKREYKNDFDIFSKEEREYRELIGIRKRQREIIKNEKKRAAVPKHWIENRVKVEREIVLDMKDKNQIVQQKIKKNEFRKMPIKRYYDEKPKHTFRAKGKKGERNR